MKKRIELWEKHACLYDISTKAFSDRVKKAAAPENISQEMNVAGWYISHITMQHWEQNTTDLLRADWLYAVQLGQLHCRSSATLRR